MKTEFWDRTAGIYDLFAEGYNRKVHRQLKEVVKSEISAEDEVLECACGSGMLTEVIAGKCRHITATDFSRAMLKRTEKKCSRFDNCTFLQADIMNLPFADESFDTVIAANVIHLLDHPVSALNELERVCRRGGKIIIPTYMNREKTGKPSMFSKTLNTAGADFRHAFTYSSYREFFRAAGREDVRFEMINGRVPCAVAIVKKPEEPSDAHA